MACNSESRSLTYVTRKSPLLKLQRFYPQQASLKSMHLISLSDSVSLKDSDSVCTHH